MAKTRLSVLSTGCLTALIVLLSVLVGCHEAESGKSQLIPPRMKAVPVVEAGEVDIIEQMSINRLAYRQYLESLVAHYKKTGNNMKLKWAESEMKKLNKIPQYNYIIEANVAGTNLKAKDSITIADYMYDEAFRLEKRAKRLFFIKDENLLRVALDKYNQLIRKYPSSDKIDDAAYRAGGICEYFKDYTIALLYYQRAYQWDPNTIHPARFKAAYVLDKYLHRRAEALELYQQAVKKRNLRVKHKGFAEKRISELTKSGESLEESK
jgi:tetratricopeptide (TPR) repeat protein